MEQLAWFLIGLGTGGLIQVWLISLCRAASKEPMGDDPRDNNLDIARLAKQ